MHAVYIIYRKKALSYHLHISKRVRRKVRNFFLQASLVEVFIWVKFHVKNSKIRLCWKNRILQGKFTKTSISRQEHAMGSNSFNHKHNSPKSIRFTKPRFKSALAPGKVPLLVE